jgi:hypothetical protein
MLEDCKALDEGVVARVSKVYKDLVIRVGKFKGGWRLLSMGESLGTNPSGRWARRVENISEEVLQQ